MFQSYNAKPLAEIFIEWSFAEFVVVVPI